MQPAKHHRQTVPQPSINNDMDRQRKLKFCLVAAIGLTTVFALLIPNHSAHAAWFDLGSIAAGAVGYMAYALIYVITTIASIFIALVTYLISVILQLSNNIVNTIAVQSGFAATLAVANLGFVLGIIIIAIATILRRETYGIKKTLWKLVVAAILVNFSLIIGGAFINLSNVLTTQFLTSLPGGGGDNGPLVFAKELAGAFAPQRLLLLNANGDTITGTVNNQSLQNANAGSTIGSIITPLISVVSATALLIVILITLAVFLFMLLIRYVALSILLVIMPFAWLMWIFPKTSNMWTKWWNEFIRWTFFAPIVIFFLWLAIATAQNMNSTAATNPLAFLNGSQYAAQGNGILAGVSTTFGSFVGSFATTLLQGVVIVGLAIGGMFAANKLSIMGASAGYGAIKGGGKAFGGWAAKRTGYYAARGAQRTMNAASRIAQPSTRTYRGGGVYTPLTTWNRMRGKAAQGLRGAAATAGSVATGPTLKKTGLAASVWGGMKKGSGLFKGKAAHDWECQNCTAAGQPIARIIRSTKKPAIPCPQCGATVAAANWTEV
jgi:hypothetical protein